MQHTFPWDRATLIWTVSTVAILLGITSLMLVLLRTAVRNQAPAWPYAAGAALCLVVLAGMAAVAPLGMRLSDSRLEIRRLVGSSHYDLEKASSVEVVPYSAVFAPGTWRTFGIGGPFGLIGRFRSPSLGSFRSAVTHRGELVVVRFRDDPPLVISPDSPRTAAEGLNAALRTESGKNLE